MTLKVVLQTISKLTNQPAEIVALALISHSGNIEQTVHFLMHNYTGYNEKKFWTKEQDRQLTVESVAQLLKSKNREEIERRIEFLELHTQFIPSN